MTEPLYLPTFVLNSYARKPDAEGVKPVMEVKPCPYCSVEKGHKGNGHLYDGDHLIDACICQRAGAAGWVIA